MNEKQTMDAEIAEITKRNLDNDTVSVGNCPLCGHFPTQFIADGDSVRYKTLPAPVADVKETN